MCKGSDIDEIKSKIILLGESPIIPYIKKSKIAKTYSEAPTEAIVLGSPASTYNSPPYKAVRASSRFCWNMFFTEEEKKKIENKEIPIIKFEKRFSILLGGKYIESTFVSLNEQNGIKKQNKQKTKINIGIQ